MNVFSSLVRFPFYPVSIEIFEDAVEVLGCLGESIPLFGVVFQEIFVLVLGCVLTRQQGFERGGGGLETLRRVLRYSLRYSIKDLYRS
jgi:hypothetical protein